jgi:hypothetical protein
MSFFNIGRTIATVALATACYASAATAGVVSYSGVYPGSPTPTSKANTDWNSGAQMIGLQKFDTNLGTLTSASITLHGVIDTSGSVQNNSASDVVVNFYTENLLISVLKPNFVGPFTPTGVLGNVLTSVNPNIVDLNSVVITTGSSSSYSGTDVGITSAAFNIVSGQFSLYEAAGGGSLFLPLYTRTQSLTDISGGTLTLVQATSAYADATITYNYTDPTPAPEPASLAVLGLGLASLGVLRRKARKAA